MNNLTVVLGEADYTEDEVQALVDGAIASDWWQACRYYAQPMDVRVRTGQPAVDIDRLPMKLVEAEISALRHTPAGLVRGLAEVAMAWWWAGRGTPAHNAAVTHIVRNMYGNDAADRLAFSTGAWWPR